MVQLAPAVRLALGALAAAIAALGIVPPHLPTLTTVVPLPSDAQELAAPPPPESALTPDPPAAPPQQGT